MMFLSRVPRLKCYGTGYQPHQDVVDFFDVIVNAFKQFTRYGILAPRVRPLGAVTYRFIDTQGSDQRYSLHRL